MPEPIYILAPVGSLDRLVRTSKIRSVLMETGRPLIHLAWKRSDDDQPNPAPVETQVILEGGGYQSSGLARWYMKYLAANKTALKNLPDGSCIYALGFFAAFPAALLARRRKFKVLFDHNDTFSKSYPLPGPLKALVEKMESFTVRRARIHLIPGENRWTQGDANRRVVPNVPTQDVAQAAKEIAEKGGFAKGERFTLYVNGWLTPERGMGPLMKALALIPDAPINILLAGRIENDDPALAALLKQPNVEFLGNLDQPNALAHYGRAHATLTFYDPVVEINRYAEPNKWGDCILTQTTFIVNREVVTAKPFFDAGSCFAVPFHDDRALADLLQRLSDNPSEAIEAGQRLKQFGGDPWEIQMQRVIQDWLA